MNLKDYQAKALETALPSALTPDYLAPMIVGEVGELFGALAKSVRDGWDEERTRKELTKEYGDIAWGVAVLLSKSSTKYDFRESPSAPKKGAGRSTNAAQRRCTANIAGHI